MFWEKIEIETYIIQSNQSKNQKIIVQNWRIFFRNQSNFCNHALGFIFKMHQTKIHFFTHSVLFVRVF